MKVIISKHAINRYRSRCYRLGRDKTRKIISNIVKSNDLIPHITPSTMYCLSHLDDIALIITTNDNGDLVVKTVMTIDQFEKQKARLKRIYESKLGITDINIFMSLGNHDEDLSVNTHMTLEE